MKKGQVFEGIVERVDFPDKGVVLVDGEKVAIKHGLPGQKLRFMVIKKKRGNPPLLFCYGKLLFIKAL